MSRNEFDPEKIPQEELENAQEGSIFLTPDDLNNMIAAAVKAATAEPEHIKQEREKKELTEQRAREMQREAIEQGRRQKQYYQDNCSHRKVDQLTMKDNGTAVVWSRHATPYTPALEDEGDPTKSALTGKLVATGICIRCQKVMGPEAAELHPEAGGKIGGATWNPPEPVGQVTA